MALSSQDLHRPFRDDSCLWGFPKIRGTILGVPITRIIVFSGLHWGPPILGNYLITSLRGPTDRTLLLWWP